jgi:hypothetical protein
MITGGKKLDAYLANRVNKLKRGELRVGFLENATYPDGTPVAQVAAWQEFGTDTIPPRPFFRNMIAAKGGDWPRSVANLLKRTDYDAEKVLRMMGEGISAQLRSSIIATDSPALSPVTRMLRKMRMQNPSLVISKRVVAEAARRVAAGQDYSGASTKVLVDTGNLLHSVGYEVRT